MPTLLLFAVLLATGTASSPYYGANVGKFGTHFHDVKGDVYAVDDNTLYIKHFYYDGKGADAVFWAGSSVRPDSTGFVIPHNEKSNKSLESYHDQDLALHLPEGRKVSDIHWLSVWSQKYPTSFGSIIFPKSFTPPQPVLIGHLNSTSDGISSGNILILDAQTFLIPDFNYDGSGKGVHWWLSRGKKPNLGGLQLISDNSDLPLQQQVNQTVIVTLPDDHSVFDYNLLSLFSSTEVEDYGSVEIPANLNIPPSPRALTHVSEREKLNCEMLNDNLGLEVKWQIEGNDIIIQLVGNIEENEYMLLGLSKDDTQTTFNASDAIVGWIDATGVGHADDYYLEGTELCFERHGMCPDSVHEGFGSNLILLNARRFGGSSEITFKRPLRAEDQHYDQNIYTDGPQAVLWAVGSLQGDLIGPPTLRTKGNLLLDFGRDPNWNCPQPNSPKSIPQSEEVAEKNELVIHCPSDHLFRAQMGPSMGNSNHNVWYINGLPTPLLTVQRGQEYTFIIEGGMGQSNRNPLYITNSSTGGHLHQSSDEPEAFFAGVHQDVNSGIVLPTSEGRHCQWRISDTDPKGSISTVHTDSTSALTLECESGNSAKLTWTPTKDTPNYVYYQSFTQKNIGGKIRVLNFCEESAAYSYLMSKSLCLEGTCERKEERIGLELEREHDYTNSEHFSKDTKYEREDDQLNPKKELSNSVGNKDNSLKTEERKTHMNDVKRQIIKFDTVNSDESIEIPTFNNGPITKQDPLTKDQPSDWNISQPLTDAIHPHDESERSDKNIHQQSNSEVKATVHQNRIPVGSQSSHKLLLTTRVVASPSVNTQNGQTPLHTESRFKPQFEGGFMPLVLNPIKEKESLLELPPLHFRRPHRPFLFNESIPFHGTFKPGVPDFSGFNISHYSQDDSPLNHVLDHLPMLSAPQGFQRPFTSMHGLPSELFQRHKGPMSIPQIFGHAPHIQDPNIRYYQQSPVLRQLPNFRPPNSHVEDLDEVSSQRVQVALQASSEEKRSHGVLPQHKVIRGPDRAHTNSPQKNNPSPPIQRRPDFVEEVSANPLLLKPTAQKYIPERRPVQNDQKIENQRIPSAMQPSGAQTPHNSRRTVAKLNFDAKKIDNGRHRLPPRGFQINPYTQNPQRNIPHFHNTKIENSHIQRNPAHTEMKMRDSMQKPQQSILHTTNASNFSNEGIEESKITSNSKDQGMLPLFLHPEMIQHSGKNPHLQTIAMNHNKMIPGLFARPNRHHLSPILFRKELNVQKPIPMRDNRPQREHIVRPPIGVNPSAPSHLSYQKEGHQHFQDRNFRKSSTIETYDLKLELSTLPSNKVYVTESPILELSEETENTTIAHQKVSSNLHDSSKLEVVLTTEIFEDVNRDVPFGARLKPNNGSQNPPSQVSKGPGTFHRKPQLTSYFSIEKNTDVKIKPNSDLNDPNFTETRRIVDYSISSPDYLKTTHENDSETTTTLSPHIPLLLSNNETATFPNTDLKATLEKSPHKFSALFLDDVGLEKHHGRKVILPNDSENSSESFNIPPIAPDNINIPQISEHPPSNDNGTNYSILSHVLSLIGGPQSS